MFIRKVLDQKGAGIILVLLVCSLIGAASLYLMDMNKVSEAKIASDSRVHSYQSLVKIVTNHLHTGNNCTNALGVGKNISGAFNPNGMSIELPLNLKMNPKILKAPVGRDIWFLQGGTSVKDVLLYVNERVRAPVRLEPVGSALWVAAKGYILIVPGHSGVGIKLKRNNFYKIPIFLYYSISGGNQILQSCFDPAGEAYFCTMSGGAYDYTATTEERRCQPDRTCFPYKAGIVNGAGSCPAPYTAMSIGYLGSDLYLCDWCNKNPLEKEVNPLKGYFYVPHPPSPYEASLGILPDPSSPQVPKNEIIGP